jgi:hypothetical protein
LNVTFLIWPTTLREEHTLRVSENRRILGPQREEVARSLRKLHNEELHSLYPSPGVIIRIIKSRRMKWAGHERFVEVRHAYRVLIGNPEGKRSLGRSRHRWEIMLEWVLKE